MPARACSASAACPESSWAELLPPAAAAQRHQTANHEARDRGADDQLLAVLTDLAAPVRELGDLAPQRLYRSGQLLLLGGDVGADLLGAPARRAGPRPGRDRGLAYSAPPSVSLVTFASSIAISGVGGEPFCIAR
jgi:hypothetical protein